MDFNTTTSKPSLTEPGIKSYLNETLKQCQRIKTEYNNMIVNISLLVGFLLLLLFILVYKYKGKLTKEEMQQKNREKQQYILSRIQNFNDAKKAAHQGLISGLPNWENEYESNVNSYQNQTNNPNHYLW